MTHRVSLLWRMTTAALLATASVAVSAQSPQPHQSTLFRSTLDLVTLHVTVTGPSGRLIEDVTNDELILLENGKPQELAVFQQGGLPLAVTILLDTSSSMRLGFSEVQDAAIAFLRRLEPADIASVIGFGSTVRVLQEFTSDRSALEQAVRSATPGGETALYTAVYIALQGLSKTAQDTDGPPRRRVAVVLSDGDDTSSLLGFRELLDAAARSDTAIYGIRMQPGTSGVPSPGNAEAVLRELARQSGGRAFIPASGHQLGLVYEEIRNELERQYAVGYVSRDTRKDGAFRSISVQVRRSGARARTKQGYFAPSVAGSWRQ